MNSVAKQGKHLIMNLYDCRDFGNMDSLYDLLVDTASDIKMKLLTKPYLVRGKPQLPGLTGFLIIETSHLSVHTFPEEKYVAFDIYSCCNFDENIVIKKIVDFFESATPEIQVMTR